MPIPAAGLPWQQPLARTAGGARLRPCADERSREARKGARQEQDPARAAGSAAALRMRGPGGRMSPVPHPIGARPGGTAVYRRGPRQRPPPGESLEASCEEAEASGRQQHPAQPCRNRGSIAAWVCVSSGGIWRRSLLGMVVACRIATLQAGAAPGSGPDRNPEGRQPCRRAWVGGGAMRRRAP